MAGIVGGDALDLQINGVFQRVKGEFTITYGGLKNSAVLGSDARVHGFKAEATPWMIKGKITDSDITDVANDIFDIRNATITLITPTGKAVQLVNATYTGDRTGTTAEGELDIEFTGETGLEVL